MAICRNKVIPIFRTEKDTLPHIALCRAMRGMTKAKLHLRLGFHCFTLRQTGLLRTRPAAVFLPVFFGRAAHILQGTKAGEVCP